MTRTRPSNARTATLAVAAVGTAVVVNLALSDAPPLAVWSGPAGTPARLLAAAATGAASCLVLASLTSPRLLLQRIRLALRGFRAPASGRFWLAAGACIEESLWRACLLPLLLLAFGAPIAIGLSSVAFGIAHAHQGVRGVLANTFNGIVFAASYLFLGGLPAAIATHLTYSMVLASILIGRRREGGTSYEAATDLRSGQ